jgi:hypothetical protein
LTKIAGISQAIIGHEGASGPIDKDCLVVAIGAEVWSGPADDVQWLTSSTPVREGEGAELRFEGFYMAAYMLPNVLLTHGVVFKLFVELAGWMDASNKEVALSTVL